MHLYIDFFGVSIPAYGMMIVLGICIANLVAFIVIKRTKRDINDLIVLEAYCFLGAFIGAKVLYLLISYEEIDWGRIAEIEYLSNIMKSGFVFYGGLIGGLLAVYLAGKLHKVDAEKYVREFIFLIPFMHGFGRIGCFMAGCCYGTPYNGPGAVAFPEESFAIPNVSLFPVQLVEAVFLLLITVGILVLQMKYRWYYTIELYLISYGVLRFALEYVRYDAARGAYAGLSTSQWLSIVLVGFAFGLIWKRIRASGRVV